MEQAEQVGRAFRGALVNINENTSAAAWTAAAESIRGMQVSPAPSEFSAMRGKRNAAGDDAAGTSGIKGRTMRNKEMERHGMASDRRVGHRAFTPVFAGY